MFSSRYSCDVCGDSQDTVTGGAVVRETTGSYTLLCEECFTQDPMDWGKAQVSAPAAPGGPPPKPISPKLPGKASSKRTKKRQKRERRAREAEKKLADEKPGVMFSCPERMFRDRNYRRR